MINALAKLAMNDGLICPEGMTLESMRTDAERILGTEVLERLERNDLMVVDIDWLAALRRGLISAIVDLEHSDLLTKRCRCSGCDIGVACNIADLKRRLAAFAGLAEVTPHD